jgi:hypothetical protein
MKSLSKKLIFLIVLVLILFATKWVLWDFNVSTGKRVGNLVKISKKGKVPFFKTWELTLDEGSGEQLTSYLSVKDESVAKELFEYEGKQVILFYEEHLIGFPRDTKYVVVSWTPKESAMMSSSSEVSSSSMGSSVTRALERSLFCSLLGGLKKDTELYEKVKEFVKKDNLYLYKQYKKCND